MNYLSLNICLYISNLSTVLNFRRKETYTQHSHEILFTTFLESFLNYTNIVIKEKYISFPNSTRLFSCVCFRNKRKIYIVAMTLN